MKTPKRRFHHSVLPLCLIGLLAFMIVVPAFAQEKMVRDTQRSQRVVLDWEKAWSMAVANNESHQMALHEQEKARLQVLEAWSNAMPTLDVNGTFNHYFMIPTNPVTMPGELNALNPGEPFVAEFKFGQENNISANAQLTQPLWLAGKVGLGLRIAKNYKQIAEMNVEVSEQDLRVQLVEAFYGALVADEYVAVTRDALDQARRHLDQVEAMLGEGVVSEYDRIRASVAVSNLKPDVIEAETARDLAYKGLKNLLGMDLDTPITIDGSITDVVLAPEMDYTTASEYAMERRVEFQQLDLQRMLYADQQKIEQRSWLWPNFMAGLRWETQAQSDKFDFQEKQFFNGTSALLIVNIPLFDGLAAHRRSQIAEVNMRNVDLQKSMLQRGIQMEVFQATRQFEKASEQLQAALENSREAEKGQSIAMARYDSGVGTQLEVLDAQLQYKSARVNVLQAEYDQLVARAQYDRALGQAR